MDDESLNLFFKGFKDAFDFEGKASREEFVVFWAYLIAINITIFLLSFVIPIFLTVYIFWNIFIAIPGLSILVRRLRDAGRSPYNLFFLLIPLAGLIYIGFLTLQSSSSTDKTQKHINKFLSNFGKPIGIISAFILVTFVLVIYHDPLRGECGKYSREYKKIVQEEVESIISFESRFNAESKECFVQIRAYDSVKGRLEIVDVVRDIFNNKTIFVNQSCGNNISCSEVEEERERVFYGK